MKLVGLLLIALVAIARTEDAADVADDEAEFVNSDPPPADEAEEASADPTADEAEPSGDKGEEAAGEQPVEEPIEVPEITLDCDAATLQQPVKTWSVDCVSLWLDKLGYKQHQAVFMEKAIDGPQLLELKTAKIIELGVTSEDDASPIMKGIKDLKAQDEDSSGIPLISMLMWLLPFIGIYKFLASKYEKQFRKINKKIAKAAPKKPKVVRSEEEIAEDWLSGTAARPSEKKKKASKSKKAD